MSILTSPFGRADGGHSLRSIEQRLDGKLCRSAIRAATRWRTRRHLFAPQLEPAGLGALESSDATPIVLISSLARALKLGALDSAPRLALLLEPRLHELTRTAAAAASELLIETWIVCGDRVKAKQLASAHVISLCSTGKGSSLLEVLGLGGGATTLPDGQINVLGLSRRVANGDLNGEELSRLLGGQLRRWIHNPELALLFWSSLRRDSPSDALGWLNRFLFYHDVPPLRWSSEVESGNPLLHLETPKLRRRARGPLVSVLVAIKDASATLGYAVESLLRQTYEPLEVLLCDDASTDSSLRVMQDLAASDPRVKLYRSSSNQGAYNIRNALAQRAAGNLLTCHDADDLATPTRIERQVSMLRATRAMACVGSWVRLDAQGRVVFFKDQKATRMALSTSLFTRDCFQRFGPFRSARVGADLEFFAALRASGPNAVARLRSPLTLGSWEHMSATRAPGTEALECGYRSPLRRTYSELVYRKHLAGSDLIREDMDERLRADGNYVEPREVYQLS